MPSVLKGRAYYLLRRCLTQKQRDEVKRWQSAARKRMGWVLAGTYGTYSAKELVDQLMSKLPPQFDILMLHSSYDHMLPMYSGQPQEILDQLIARCGKDRTLAMPAFVLGGRSRDKKHYYQTHTFDIRRTPSEMGFLTELFRRRAGVKRSLHPTHSICALGPLADQLTANHQFAPTRAGHGTPFEIMARKRCVIAGVGVEYFRVLAQTHAAEDMLGDEFPLQFEKETFPVNLKDWEGKQTVYDLTVLKTPQVLDNTLLRTLLQKDELKEWRFRGTCMFMTYADKVTNALLKAAETGLTVYGSYPANPQGGN